MKRLIALCLCFALSVLSACGGSKSGEELFMYIWAEYIPDSVFKQFEDETGIKIRVSTFDNLDDMFAKIKITDGGEGYDLVMPSIEYASLLKNQGYLQKLDKRLLPNFKNMDPNYVNLPFDKGNEYTVPFTVGTSTFAVNSKKVDPEKLKKLEDLSRPEYKKRLLLLNDIRAVMGIGLRMNGHSINDRNKEHIKQAYETLKEKILPNVKGFDTEAAAQALLNGEVDIAMTWNGLVYASMQENPDIVEVRMNDGMNFWMDSFALLKKSKNVVNAHKFLDFIMRPDVSAKITSEYQYSSPNAAARKLLPEKVRNNKTLYPDKSDVQKGEFENDIGDALPVYEKYWTKIKTGS